MAQWDFQRPPLLENDEIESILARIDELTNWATAVKEYAFDLALKGHKWNDFKLVEGRSIRKYTDNAAVVDALLSLGYDAGDILKPAEPLGISAMEKTLGKKQFSQVLGALVEKPAGKPVLVPRSDKREELNSVSDDFQSPLNFEETE
jgi:hypothetical protein